MLGAILKRSILVTNVHSWIWKYHTMKLAVMSMESIQPNNSTCCLAHQMTSLTFLHNNRPNYWWYCNWKWGKRSWSHSTASRIISLCILVKKWPWTSMRSKRINLNKVIQPYRRIMYNNYISRSNNSCKNNGSI